MRIAYSKKGIFLCGAALMVGWATDSVAAPDPVSATSAEQAPPADDQIADIVVTAQRRSESLQKVPIAISQFSGESLQRLSVVSAIDLQRVTPGFNFQSESGSAQLSIRGVGTGFSGQGLEQSVALYLDGAYVASQMGAVTPLVDVRQVQVLKGPQGALYGRNATGGAVLIDTNDPDTDALSGYGRLGYGNYNWYRAEAVVNVPLSDVIAVRFAGQFQDRDSFFHNERTNTDLYGQRSYYGRGKILIQPSDDFEIVAGAEYYHDRQEAPHINIAEGSLCSYCTALGIGRPSGFYRTYENTTEELEQLLGSRAYLTGNTRGEVNTRVFNANLRITYDVGALTVRSVTSYRHAKQDGPNNDQDGGPNPLLFTLSQISNKAFNEDIQVSSNFDGTINFTAGFNYEHDRNRYPLGLAGSVFGPLVTITDSRDRTNSYSVFGELYYRFLDGFTLTAGARFTKDKRYHEFTNNADAALVFGETFAAQRADYDSFTPRVVIAYDAGDSNYYVSFNKGIKAGGFNSPSYNTADPVSPEKITAYEVGAKYQLLDRRLRLNLAAFHYDWSNLQVAVIDSANGGLAQQNAAAATADGAEFALDMSLARGLSLSLAGMYLNSQYKDFPAASVFVPAASITPGATGQVQASEDLRGFATPNAPKLSGSGTLNYTFDVGSTGWTADATGVLSYKSKYDQQPGAGGSARLIRQKGHAIANARVAVNSPDDRLTFEIWADNITKTRYYSNRVATVDGAYGTPGAPRTFGFRVTGRY